MVPTSSAIAAYQAAAKEIAPGFAPTGAEQPTGTSFADMLRDVGESAIESGRESDRVSALAIDGKASVTEVVTAVTSAELTLQTVVAVRDRVVEAYQSILRMPI